MSWTVRHKGNEYQVPKGQHFLKVVDRMPLINGGSILRETTYHQDGSQEVRQVDLPKMSWVTQEERLDREMAWYKKYHHEMVKKLELDKESELEMKNVYPSGLRVSFCHPITGEGQLGTIVNAGRDFPPTKGKSPSLH